MQEKDIKILSRNTRYQGFFRVEEYRLQHRLFNGDWSGIITRELFERGHAVAVLPFDPIRDEIILIEQFRIGALQANGGAWLTEIVAGIIEDGESLEDVARRETIEESGCNITNLIPIGTYLVSPGGTSEQITLFCGQVDSARAGGIHGKADEGEDIRVNVVSLDKALTMLRNGIINSAIPIIALQWLALNHDRLRALWVGDTP